VVVGEDSIYCDSFARFIIAGFYIQLLRFRFAHKSGSPASV
jgi:hypothetical protein